MVILPYTAGHVAMDLSWVLCSHDLPTRYKRTATKLVNRYFARLQALGGAAGATIEQFREELALMHIVTLSRAILITHQVDIRNKEKIVKGVRQSVAAVVPLKKDTHTNTHTEREREREIQSCFSSASACAGEELAHKSIWLSTHVS